VSARLHLLGAELAVDTARQATRLAAMNALAIARHHLESLDKVTRIVVPVFWWQLPAMFAIGRGAPLGTPVGLEVLSKWQGKKTHETLEEESWQRQVSQWEQ
jgi:hypothetical protein